MSDYNSDTMGLKSYVYAPKWDKLVDLNPDHRPSDGGLDIAERNGKQYWTLPVHGYGVMVLSIEDTVPSGMCVFEDAVPKGSYR